MTESFTRSALGRRLLELRTQAGMTQADMGAKSGLSRAMIGHMEASRPGLSTVSYRKAFWVFKILLSSGHDGSGARYFLRGEPVMPPNEP